MLLRCSTLWMVAKRARLNHTMPVIGIKREEKSRWECRAPLTPSHLAKLKESHPDLRVLVQPCNKRVFTDEEWRGVGAEVKDDLSEAQVILGVKEVPLSIVQPNKTYLCFSHTHKGQSYNMPGLRRFLEQKCTLIDYELLTDEAGRRLVAFGEFAGYAGMIDCLSGLGDRLLQRGMHTPLLHLGLAHHYTSLEEAERAVKVMGEQIASQGLPASLPPMTFIFTGNGNVSRGAQRIFRLLPHRWVKPEELASVQSNGHEVIGCIVEAEHYMERKDGKPFDPVRFRTNPEEFESFFAKKIAPYASVLINGIYWEPKYPRLLSKEDLKRLVVEQGNRRLLAITDITCDIDGSVEMTSKASTIEKPFFLWDPHTLQSAGYEKGADLPDAIQMMTIDCLPTQLPRDASQHFGDRLLPILEELIVKGSEADTIARATIVKGGELAPDHLGLQRFLNKLDEQVKIKDAPKNDAAPNEYHSNNPLTI